MAAMKRGSLHSVTSLGDLNISYLEPEPDYISNEESEDNVVHLTTYTVPTADVSPVDMPEAYGMYAHHSTLTSDVPTSSSVNDPQLTKRRISIGSYIDSKERQALHRELIMTCKMGKDILKKPELNKVLRERREKERKKEWDEQKSSQERTSLPLKLEERANRIKKEEDRETQAIAVKTQTPELVRVHRKIQKTSCSAD